jgi:hypothetical protein
MKWSTEMSLVARDHDESSDRCDREEATPSRKSLSSWKKSLDRQSKSDRGGSSPRTEGEEEIPSGRESLRATLLLMPQKPSMGKGEK